MLKSFYLTTSTQNVRDTRCIIVERKDRHWYLLTEEIIAPGVPIEVTGPLSRRQGCSSSCAARRAGLIARAAGAGLMAGAIGARGRSIQSPLQPLPILAVETYTSSA
ncbi:hypothetical protein FRX31_006668 [Thalictrum thalictroides]|uniref:Uncharacterized protein n=1 Tax=Thalictrum thalictroides TaxID=46969 RepID=A0A7J6X4J2_THATH|nr:hypothetical protein FRX31_006668 [Thalictrum thalictroides]